MSTMINADTDPNGVSEALGLDDATEPDTVDADQEVDQDDDEVTLETLAAALAELKRDNAKLKREAAAARVAAKSKGKAADAGSGDTRGVTGEARSLETVEQARERGKEEARLEYGVELAKASITAALTGIIPEVDLEDFVDDLRAERYLDEDGKPDKDAIGALRDRQAKITRRKPSARVGHGRQSDGGGQKSKSDLLGETLSILGI